MPRNLVITNSSGSNTNIISQVLINGNLSVSRNYFGGYNELHILASEVTGDTHVDNDGEDDELPGDSKTVIDTSLLRGRGGDPALRVENAAGMDVLTVNGNSQFGDGATFDPIVDIRNGNGPTMTTFTGSSKVFGPGTTTIYGDLDITNDDNALGTLDVTTFNKVNVFGDVYITNGNGNTETMVVGSVLFSDLLPENQELPSPEHASGAGVGVVLNSDGFDTFESTNSDYLWGLYIDNDFDSGGDSTWAAERTLQQYH